MSKILSFQHAISVKSFVGYFMLNLDCLQNLAYSLNLQRLQLRSAMFKQSVTTQGP